MEKYIYEILVNNSKYGEATSHQQLIEMIEQIKVDRGEGASYSITLNKRPGIMNCPCCKSSNTRLDYDFPETMRCCDSCGADFMEDGEIILNPKEIV